MSHGSREHQRRPVAVDVTLVGVENSQRALIVFGYALLDARRQEASAVRRFCRGSELGDLRLFVVRQCVRAAVDQVVIGSSEDAGILQVGFPRNLGGML